MKKAEIFFDAITNIREDLIEEALNYQFYKRAVPWRRYLRNAACLALVVLVGFGAVRFGLLGGWGGSDSANNTASDMAAGSDTTADTALPESEHQASPESPEESGAGSQDDDGGDGIPSDPASRFTATVLEVHENYLLVEPDADTAEASSADRIEVSTGDVDDLPVMAVGDRVTILYNGAIQETYPARVTGVLEITLAE